MSFFDRGKNKEGRPQTTPTDKSEYSLFRNKPAGTQDEQPADQNRSLRIVRGKGAVSVDADASASAPTPTPASEPSAQPEIPASASGPTEPQKAPRTGGLFSRARKGAQASLEPAAASESPASAPHTDAAKPEETPVDDESPRSSGFLSRLKGKGASQAASQEPTFSTQPDGDRFSSGDSRQEMPPTTLSLEADNPPAKAESTDVSSTEPPKKGGLLGLGKRTSESATSDKTKKGEKTKSQKPEKPKKPQASKPRGANARNVHIYVQLDGNQREFFWALRNDHIEEVGREAVSAAASFSRDDIAVRTAKSLSFKAAQDAALQEIGEPVHLVNRSKDLNYVYATREERPLTAGFRLLPGQQALDRIIKRRKLLQGKPLITGFTFTNSQGQVAVAILYHVAADGVVTRPQVTLNPDRMEFVLNEFAKQRKLNRKDSEVVLFGNEDFLSEVASLQAYPVEPVWRGIPVSRVWRAAAVLALAGAVGSCAWTAMGFIQQQGVNRHITRLNAEDARNKEDASRLIGTSLYSFAQSLSIDQDHVFDIAQQLWMPGTKLEVEAKPDRTVYHVKVPVVTNKTFNNRPSVDATPPKSQVDVALKIVAPAGCRKDTASVSGNMNEIEISVVCENRRTPLSGFRND